jgi:hypothetical protein
MHIFAAFKLDFQPGTPGTPAVVCGLKKQIL